MKATINKLFKRKAKSRLNTYKNIADGFIIVNQLGKGTRYIKRA